MDKFQEMRIFQAVGEANGFAAAARSLRLSGATVTRAIASLEERLGARLLYRTTRSVHLTEIGECFLVDCQRILKDIVDSEQSASSMQGEPKGKLVISATVMFGHLYVAPIISEFLEKHARMQIRTLFVDRHVNLVNDGVDIAFHVGEMPDSGLRAVQVGSVRNVLCASPGYLKEHGTPKSPADLASHRLINFSGYASRSDWAFPGRAGGAQAATAIKIEPLLNSNTAEVAIGAALAGRGITRLYTCQIDAHVRQGTLKIVLTDHEPVRLPVYVLHHGGRKVSAKVQAFFDYSIQMLRANPVFFE